MRSHFDLQHAHVYCSLIKRLRRLLLDVQTHDRRPVDEIGELIESCERHADASAPSTALNALRLEICGLLVLRSHYRCQDMARSGAPEILAERERRAVLSEALWQELQKLGAEDARFDAVCRRLFRNQQTNVDPVELVSVLRKLPLPLTYRRAYEETERVGPTTGVKRDTRTPLIRLVAFIDGEPLVGAMRLQPNLQYSIRFDVLGTIWPNDAHRMVIDAVTTTPRSDFTVSNFEAFKPQEVADDEYRISLSGFLSFRTAQTLLSENHVFVVRAAFEGDDGIQEVPVIGHRQLEFRVVDSERVGVMSGYPRMDEHVCELLEGVLAECPTVRSELPALVPVLRALNALLGTYAQSAVFKKMAEYDERAFQRDVIRDLRLQLGSDVEEHPSQAGGSTDVRYRGVVVELKVETVDGNRSHICAKYTRQAVQYEGVEARQVSAVLVLDLTPKDDPPGDIRNDVRVASVRTHGNDASSSFPSKVFVFIVNGNVRNPSSYSN